jgi:predicted  nucleic acid-binding Zn-ribbon protein
MSNPNFCPECGHNLQQYSNTDKQKINKNTEDQSGEDLTREDYRKILDEELEKAEEHTAKDQEPSEKDTNPELEDAIKTAIEADEEVVENMPDGFPKKAVKDVRDIANGKAENLRIF